MLEVPLPSIRQKLPIETILRGSNEAQAREDLRKNREKGNTYIVNIVVLVSQIKQMEELNETQKTN
ncbi:MAG: hypothetical protein LBE76_00150 [Nitrososphaerota archaeon]|nr:hypothetical protein [Nitrososphaerota archaeon]